MDNIYLQTTIEEKANKFHSTMNSLHSRLTFEIEKPTTSPQGLSLSLLDFKVTISVNSESSFEYYKKPAKKPLPRNSKINFICNERKRIQQKCSTQTIFHKHACEFDNKLCFNRYPEDAINESKCPQNHPLDPQSQNTEWLYLKIPFISNRLDREIMRENLPVCALLYSTLLYSDLLYSTLLYSTLLK